MKVDGDIIQRIKVAGIFLLQSYKILTGSLLTIFIPQKCENYLITTNSTEIKICSLEENFNNNDLYHKKTLYWNILTMILFFGYYLIELKRENWSIKYLDIDHDKPDNALKEIIRNEPNLDKKMDVLNFYYYTIVRIAIVFYFINISLMIRILYTDYHSSSTISSFISFVLLVVMKLYNSFIVAKASVSDDKMMSAYVSEFVSYNVLDEDYFKNKKAKP
jgi:hypothetical protein